MKLPAALCYFGILFVALAASGETAGEAEEVATAPLEPLSPDDSFEQRPAARSLRGIWEEEAGDFIIWGAEGDDFRTAPTSPPTAAPDDLQDSETAGGGEVDAKTEEDISVTQAPPGKCHQVFKTLCKQFDPISCVRSSIAAKKYCKLNSTTKKCVDKCAGLKIATCTKEKHCTWVK